MSTDETPRNGTDDPTLRKVLHPEKKRSILKMWLAGLKNVLNEDMLPRVLISIRVDSHLEQKFQINITYPGLTAKQVLPLLAMAMQAVSEKAKKEEITGPRIVIPS